MNDAHHKSRNNNARKRKRAAGFPLCLAKYKQHFTFLRDAKFLEDLEKDSVDSDIIDEELKALHQVPISTRERVVKFLQSNPVQILLCIIVLLDAGIVIAQILLDLNSVKEKLYRRDIQLSELIEYVRDSHRDLLGGYRGADATAILRLLKKRRSRASLTSTTAAAQGAFGPIAPGRNSSDSRPTNDSVEEETATGTEKEEEASTGAVGAAGSVGGNVSESGDISTDNNGSSVDEDDDAAYTSDSLLYEGKYDALHDVAHWLHFASISLLGFLVIEDIIKMLAMGWTFCKHKIEIFDAVIISSSFTIDLVFLNGVSGEEGQKAAAVLVVLLLWRIARVVDGIVVTVKQRQEFRIRLQKRARRMAERKLETYEEERQTKSKQIEALKDLCSKAGINEADIAACAPRNHGHVTNTLDALSSVAKLSVSMTMLMSSGVYHKPTLMTSSAAGAGVADGGGAGSASLADDVSSDSRSLSIRNLRYAPLRIESLPNIQHGSGGCGGGSPTNDRRRVFSSKLRRKRLPGTTRATAAATAVVVDPPGRRRSVQDSLASTCSVTASSNNDPAMMTTTMASPVNSCGVRIVIDGIVDGEDEDEEEDNEIEAATVAYSNSGLSFVEMDDDDVTAASNSQMFLLSDVV